MQEEETQAALGAALALDLGRGVGLIEHALPWRHSLWDSGHRPAAHALPLPHRTPQPSRLPCPVLDPV